MHADYKSGFGGQYGVQSDRVDKSAVGWDHREDVPKHQSQTDYSKGFGGKFGVQQGSFDKTAHNYDEGQTESVGTNYERTRPSVPAKNASNLRARFESMAQQSTDEAKARADEEKRRREAREKREREEAEKREEQRRAREAEEEAERKKRAEAEEEERRKREEEELQARARQEEERRKKEEERIAAMRDQVNGDASTGCDEIIGNFKVSHFEPPCIPMAEVISFLFCTVNKASK